jgi:hypothetical protein
MHHKNIFRTTHKIVNYLIYVRFEVFRTVDYEKCRLMGCDFALLNRRFVGAYRLHHQADKNRRGRNNVSSNLQPKHGRILRLLVTADVLSSPIFVILMMEEIRSSKTSVITKATFRNIPEDGILYLMCFFSCILISLFILIYLFNDSLSSEVAQMRMNGNIITIFFQTE